MKKYKKLLIILLLIIITVITLLIYSKLCYSRKEILSIINRSDETFSNIYIKVERDCVERDEKYINEYYAKDNIIYTYSYTEYPSLNDIVNIRGEIWNLNTKEKIYLNHSDKIIYIDTIRGKRIS